MQKINFINNSEPALNATNLNKMQDNVEDELDITNSNITSLSTNKLDKTSVKDTYSTSVTDTYSCNYINGLETYSTDETRVGTWIDGKPLYRKVLTGTLPNGSGENLFVITDAEILNAKGIIKSSYNQWWPIPSIYTSDGYHIYYYISGRAGSDVTGKNTLKIDCGSYFNTSSKYFIILEYTKNTD